MLPVLLAARSHNQKAAILQPDFTVAAAMSLVTKVEGTHGPQADAGNGGSAIKLRFIIGVPPHLILATAIEIE